MPAVARAANRCIALLLLTIAPVCAPISTPIIASAAMAADVTVETVAEGLDHPWGIAFLPDGRWLVTERAGQLRVIDNGALLETPVSGVPPVYANSQGGLMDIVLAPDFATSRALYLSLAHGEPGANATRVVRAVLDGNALTDVTSIFTAAPLKDTPVHYGGRLAWMTDGTLLVTLGDGFDYREAAQRLDSHLGTIVRINADGTVPASNPFVGDAGARPEIYTYGNRNVQGVVVEPTSGRVYAHEHGPKGGDELNLISPGSNYGWPAATYGLDYTGAVISPYTDRPGTVQPMLQWTPSIAPSGMALYTGELFPAWRGDLLITSLAERSLRRVDLRADGKLLGQSIIDTGLNSRLRHVAVAPDGSIVLLEESKSGPQGRVLRLTPKR